MQSTLCAAQACVGLRTSIERFILGCCGHWLRPTNPGKLVHRSALEEQHHRNAARGPASDPVNKHGRWSGEVLGATPLLQAEALEFLDFLVCLLAIAFTWSFIIRYYQRNKLRTISIQGSRFHKQNLLTCVTAHISIQRINNWKIWIYYHFVLRNLYVCVHHMKACMFARTHPSRPEPLGKYRLGVEMELKWAKGLLYTMESLALLPGCSW